MKSNEKKIKEFKKIIWQYYRTHGRHDLSWRKTLEPYKILVSEIMLQQTQVERVKEKFKEFVQTFPTTQSLARAPFRKVLKVWSGLGYNRRALMLHRCAQEIVKKHHGNVPDEVEILKTLPGIGPYTAGAIHAFAFNKPTVETV